MKINRVSWLVGSIVIFASVSLTSPFNPNTSMRSPSAASLTSLAGNENDPALAYKSGNGEFMGIWDQPDATELITVTLTPVADAYTISDLPGLNYGDAEFLELAREMEVPEPVDAQGWIRFDLADIPHGADIEHANLHLTLPEGGFRMAMELIIYPVMDEWQELGITYDSHPTTLHSYEFYYLPEVGYEVDWDVTELVQGWFYGEAPTPNFGWNLRPNYIGDEALRFISSRESQNPPELTIIYVRDPRQYIFHGKVLAMDERPLPGVPVALYSDAPWDEGELNWLEQVVTTNAAGEFWQIEDYPPDTPPLTYTLVISSSDYTVTQAIPGLGGSSTPEGYLRYPNDVTIDYYPGNRFIVQPRDPPEWLEYSFNGFVYGSSPSEPAPQVEVALYGASDPMEPELVLASASTDPTGGFRLPYARTPETNFPFYVIQVADLDYQARDAAPGGLAFETEDHRIVYASPEPGIHLGSTFQVESSGYGMRVVSPQVTEYRPVVAVILSQNCTCGTLNCTPITNPQVLTAFGNTIFDANHESLNTFFLSNSQDSFGLTQAGLFMVTPQDDPDTSGNESNNCPNPDIHSEEDYRAYFARTVLGDQLNFDFAQYDADHNGTVEDSELIAILAWTSPTEFDAKVRKSDPGTLEINGINVNLSYASFQAGQSFYTMAHEVAHTMPFELIDNDFPGDMYGGQGNPGAYGLMDNTCHGVPLTVTQNTPYTATQRMFNRLPNLDPWTKIQLGWINPYPVTSSSWQTLYPLDDNGSVLKLGSAQNGKEYFLVESRHPEGSIFESDLLDSGLAIWHIDESYLPDHRRVVALERAGGGANSGASNNGCDDDRDDTALYDGSEDFWESSVPGSKWSDLTDSGIAVMCVNPPADEVNAYIGLNWTEPLLLPDSDEPNNELEYATHVTPGYYDRNLQAPCDTDYYTITHWMSATLGVTVQAYYDILHTQPAPAPNVILHGTEYGNYPTYQGVGSVSGFFKDYGNAAIAVSGATKPVYYRITFTNDKAVVPPDRFDDETPFLEQRNDSLLFSAQMPGPLDEAIGFTPSLEIADLNLERSTDEDFFTIQLPPAVHPMSGHQECLAPSDPRYGEQTTQGGLLVKVTPFYKRTFTIGAYHSNGVVFTNYDRLGPLEMYIECPHDHLNNDTLKFKFDDPSNQINFYKVDFYYHRWAKFVEFPEWLTLTDPPLFEPMPAYYDPRLKFIYPASLLVQEDLFAGVAVFPLPTEFLPFHWSSSLPFKVDLITQYGENLNMRLYDSGGLVVGQPGPVFPGIDLPFMAQTGLRTTIDVPFLPPGWYALGIDGAENFVEYWLRFAVWNIALPLVIR